MMLGRIGDVIVGRYRLDRPVSGAVGGEVWQAFDERLARPVRVTPGGPLAQAAADDAGRQLIATMAQLNHPGIAAIYDVGVTDDFGYTVSEWTEGRTLAQIMATGPQSWQRVSDWGQQAGAALAALHAAGIIHGALSPETIVIHDDRQLKILDAGIATLAWQLPPGPGGSNDPGFGAPDRDDDQTWLIPPTGAGGGARGGSRPDDGADDETRRIPPRADETQRMDRSADETRFLAPQGADDLTRALPRDASSGRAEDVWALGALSWQAVVGPNQPGVTPGSAPDPRQLRAATGSAGFCDLVLRMVAVDPVARPSALQASDGFAALLAAERSSTPLPVGVPIVEPTRELRAPAGPGAQIPPASGPASAMADEPSGSRRGLAIGLVLLLAAVGLGVGLYVANSGGNAGAPSPVSSTSTTVTTPATTGAVVLPSGSVNSTTSTPSPSSSPSSAPTTAAPTTAAPSTPPPTSASPSSSPSAPASDPPASATSTSSSGAGSQGTGAASSSPSDSPKDNSN
jgi:eukaryotic-like serine/threonine-protein kinase